MRSPGKRLIIYCTQIVKAWCNLGLLYAVKAEGGREIRGFRMQINAEESYARIIVIFGEEPRTYNPDRWIWILTKIAGGWSVTVPSCNCNITSGAGGR